MIPPFDDNSYLPSGVHTATLDEIEQRFGRDSELRQVEMQFIHWLAELARRAGVERLIVNGSFVTDVVEPNDVDCVLLPGPDYPRDAAAAKELADGLPFIDFELLEQPFFDRMVMGVFGTDRQEVAKGVVEVLL